MIHLFKSIFIIFIMSFCLLFYSELLNANISPNQFKNFVKKRFNTQNDRSSYALGVSLGSYINTSFQEQQKLGVILSKDSLLLGISDSVLGKSLLSENEVAIELKKLEEQLKYSEQIVWKKELKKNKINGEKYIKKILLKKNFNQTSSGLIFFIEKVGKGNVLKDSDVVTVHYKGSLIDGSEFDNSYKRGKPLSFPLNTVILGWQEGLKYIRKGGKIKLIIPPKLAYGETGVPGIPGNSTLIFDIELVNIKS